MTRPVPLGVLVLGYAGDFRPRLTPQGRGSWSSALNAALRFTHPLPPPIEGGGCWYPFPVRVRVQGHSGPHVRSCPVASPRPQVGACPTLFPSHYGSLLRDIPLPLWEPPQRHFPPLVGACSTPFPSSCGSLHRDIPLPLWEGLGEGASEYPMTPKKRHSRGSTESS